MRSRDVTILRRPPRSGPDSNVSRRGRRHRAERAAPAPDRRRCSRWRQPIVPYLFGGQCGGRYPERAVVLDQRRETVSKRDTRRVTQNRPRFRDVGDKTPDIARAGNVALDDRISSRRKLGDTLRQLADRDFAAGA
jgi:hypothetical protein